MKSSAIKWAICLGLLSLLFTAIGWYMGASHHVAARTPRGVARVVMVVLGWPSMLSYFPECATREYLKTVYDHYGRYGDINLFHLLRIATLNLVGWSLLGFWIKSRRKKHAAIGAAVVVTLAATFALPGLRPARQQYPAEPGAISYLRTLSSAQAQFQCMPALDTDGDGTGEYGFFNDLMWTSSARLNARQRRGPSILVQKEDQLVRDALSHIVLIERDYVFKVFLPGPARGGRVPGIAEGSGKRPSPSEAERAWCAYAWPLTWPSLRAFFINERGDIFVFRNIGADGEPVYVGTDGAEKIPKFDAIFSVPGDMRSPIREGASNDGNLWKETM